MEPRRRVSIGGLVLIAMVMSALGGGLVGGVTGFRLAKITAPPTPVEATFASPPPAVSTPASSATTSGPTADNESQIVDVVKRTAPAVVTVLNTLNAGGQSSGSGVIFSQDGYMVTNHHVVEDSARLQVIFVDGSTQDARLVGSDPFSDLAVLQVNGGVPAFAALGDSDGLQPGQTVIAIGSPLGTYKNSVTTGVVSALNRSVQPSPNRTMEGLIQTDAAINHGNSGGPLLNLQGEVIGINTLVVRGSMLSDPTDVAQGLGFAVPSNTVKTVVEHLIKDGRVDRPYLGISYEMISRELAATNNLPVDQGALVTDVPTDATMGPAARAGILPQDIITEINGEPVTEQRTLQQILLGYKPGETVTLSVVRNGQKVPVELTLGTRPPSLDQSR